MNLLRPMQLERFLRQQLDNGKDKLTYKEISRGVFGVFTPQHLDEIKRCWREAEKRMRQRDVCAILVTELYFEGYTHREPKTPKEIADSIALEGRAAAGVRLLTLKDSHNDLVALTYFVMRARNVQGGMLGIADRVTVEWKHGKISKRIARKIITDAIAPALPYHGDAFKELMDL